MKAEMLVDTWLGMLSELTPCFTEPGGRRFAALLTGALLAERRPLVTEIVTALGLESQWRAAEAFVEYGRWPVGEIEKALCRMAAPAARWHGRQIWATDDMKTLKTGKTIWGACSFHEYTSRCSNRPETVWAHNWVVFGALSMGEENDFLPTMGRLYMRDSQLPDGEQFRTKPQLLVQMARLCARAVPGPHLAVFDGGYAIRTVVGPLASPPQRQPGVEFVTRLRGDSRLYTEPPPRQQGHKGRPRKWGYRLPAPNDADQWPGPWREGRAKLYRKPRRIRYKQVLCQWHPAGAEARVRAFVFHIEGYNRPWNLVTSDLGLTAQQVVELYAARFSQEDAHRDLKQHLGLGAGQGRLKAVVVRTFQLRLVAMTLLRVLARRLEMREGAGWWPKPPWYPQKRRGSLRDIKRLIVGAGEHFSQLDWRRLTLEKRLKRSGSEPLEPLTAQTAPHRAA